jgi:hypothetical protein
MADDTFAGKGWKPLLLANPGQGLATYRDNGGVVYAAYAVTRTGETHASRDVSKCASSNDLPLGVPVEIIHADGTSWDYDEVAADNDAVIIALIGSGHVVTMMMASAQGDLEVGQLLMVDSAGRAALFTAAAASGDSIDQIRKDLGLMIGRLYADCSQDGSDPKDNIFCKVHLNV